MTYPNLTAYAYALFGALCAAGIPAADAMDCARNAAQVLSMEPQTIVYGAVLDRLCTQRTAGSLAGVRGNVIQTAARMCNALPRYQPTDVADGLPIPAWQWPVTL